MIFSKVEFNEDEPIYKQIENYIKEIIDNNMIANNGKLPATREMSKILGVSRNSVITAYANLEAEGVLYVAKGKGTFISPRNIEEKDRWNVEWGNLINDYGKIANELDIVKTEVPWKKGVISFKSIAPDGSLFDIDDFKKSFLNRISVEEDKILNYGYAKGYRPLIEYLKEYMIKKGVDTEGKDILITNGFTEALDIILSTYMNKGDSIICENPTHNTAIKIMKTYGLNIEYIDMDEEGLNTNKLREKLKEGNIKFGYIIPSYHNPTGLVMKGDKRQEVYNIFKDFNVPIIEDGFNEELLYNSSHISPLASLDTGSGVIYISSFSKVLFPGIRIGWILADKNLIDSLQSVKRCRNIHTSFLDQGILYEYLNEGYFDKNIKKTRKVYREKYRFAKECIEKYLDYKYMWGEGGLHIFIGLNNIDSRELLKRCDKKGVIFMPGDIFSLSDKFKNTIRLGLSKLSLEEIEEGIRIIGETIKELGGK